ncbi:MAG: hypothetical protein N2689_14385, partial [Verrucomicrobiae bacterium]|nr:hypothetical protein [Verrucomicrobiae bacterium]
AIEEFCARSGLSEDEAARQFKKLFYAKKKVKLGEKVLTVDDNATQRVMMEMWMKGRGLLAEEDAFERGAMTLLNLLLPVIARYVRPEDKPAFDADVARAMGRG